MSSDHFRELIEDLQVERHKLAKLVASLEDLLRQWTLQGGTGERVDAAALRLQSFYTGVERCFSLISRVLNGGALATDERPALLEPATTTCLGDLLRFRHMVRHLYAYELDPPQVKRLLEAVPELWEAVDGQLQAFEDWLRQLASGAG